MKQKILYLTAIENILHSGVLKSQVIDLLMKISELAPANTITLFSLVPIHNYFKFFSRRKKLIYEFKRINIEFKIQPIIFLTRFFYLKQWQLLFFICQALPILAFQIWRHKPVIIHARSYPAAFIAALLKRLFSYNLIFDMKGLYIAEGELLKRFSSADTRKWDKIEKWLFNQADHVIGVSPEFKNFISDNCINKYSTVPCCVNPANFSRNIKIRQEIREKYQLTSRIIFVFSGSIGLWEPIQALVQLFANIRKEIPAAFLLIITQTQNKQINSIFEQIGKKNYLILHLPPDKVPDFLIASDIGLVFRQIHLINKVSLTVKFGEYLAAGLPVLITASAGEAARLAKIYQCGVVIEDENDIHLKQKIRYLLADYGALKDSGAKLVIDYLNISNCARKYLEIYEQCVNLRQLFT